VKTGTELDGEGKRRTTITKTKRRGNDNKKSNETTSNVELKKAVLIHSRFLLFVTHVASLGRQLI